MANLIQCPKCRQAVGEAQASYQPGDGPHLFVVTHLGVCGHTWTAHHREFYREGSAPPRPKNPFEPVRLVF